MLLIIESCVEIGPLVLELKPNKRANELSDKLLEIYKHVELIYVLVAVLLNHQTGRKKKKHYYQSSQYTAYRPRNKYL